MRRAFHPVLAAVAIALGAAGCDSGSPTTPTTPPPAPTVTDTFSGSITVNGSMSFTFASLAAGPLSAQIKSLTPDGTVTVGFSIGVFNGTTCQVTLANDSAIQGTTILGNINGSGLFCARIHDVGKLADATSFEITVTHP
jgi:hypothetical protein